jgi:hypothetical protein
VEHLGFNSEPKAHKRCMDGCVKGVVDEGGYLCELEGGEGGYSELGARARDLGSSGHAIARYLNQYRWKTQSDGRVRRRWIQKQDCSANV